MKFFKPPKTVYAHCDIPCGIYDPYRAQIAALTVLRMMDLIYELKDISDITSIHDVARHVTTKEEHAELCKHEVRIIWGDYFKDGYIEKYPELHLLTHRIMQAGSGVKHGTDRGLGEELLGAVNRFAEIFWETKGIKTKRVKSPHKPEEEIIYPLL